MKTRLILFTLALASLLAACTQTPTLETAATAPYTVDPEAGRTIEDAEARDARALMLYSSSQSATFRLDEVPSGTYNVSVRARAQAYKGWPVMRLNLNGQPLGQDNPVKRESYGEGAQQFGEATLKAGQVITAEFVNDLYEGSGKDRNLIIDHLILEPTEAQPDADALQLTSLWDKTRVLDNPHKGWYHHFYDDGLARYGGTKREIDAFPGLNLLYLRFPWSHLEPREGEFNWALIDDLVAEWEPDGYTFAFAITTRETGGVFSTPEDQPGYATPQWVEAAGAQGTWTQNWGEWNWEPDYGDPIFLEKLNAFHRAFAERYKDRPWLEFVDVRSYGDWGEGHTHYGSQRAWPVDVVKRHIDIHTEHYDGVPLYISDAAATYERSDEESATLEKYIGAQGVSWRDDSVLVDYYLDTFPKTSLANPDFFDAWRTRPALLEFEHYHLVLENNNWSGKNGAAQGAEVVRRAVETSHASYIGYHGEAAQWLADNPDLARELANKVGYWYFPVTLTLPKTLRAAQRVPLDIAWENHGVAPAYHDFALEVKFTHQKTGKTGKRYVQRLASNNRAWLPAEVSEERYQVDTPTAQGTYDLALRLVEPTREQRVEIGLRETLRDDEGFYRLGRVEVKP